MSLSLTLLLCRVIRATLEGWRSTIRAEVVAEEFFSAPVTVRPYPQLGGRVLCCTHVIGTTNPADYNKHLALKQQAEELQAEEEGRGQHLEK